MRIKGSRSKRSPRSRGGEEGVLGRQEACLGEVVGCRGGRGGGQGASRPRMHWGHRNTGPHSPSPRQAHPWLCAQPAVSKDVCLFLEQRFLSFHFNCLLLSWACESAGLCYKGESQPRGPDMAASCMAKSVFWFIG